MRHLPILSTPPAITITNEPLDDAAALSATGLSSAEGLELVPAWQARPPRRMRRLSAVVPLVAVLAASVLWLERGGDARALRERPAAAVAPEAAPVALVVSAGPARGANSGATGRTSCNAGAGDPSASRSPGGTRAC
jgi:hypothetical protein